MRNDIVEAARKYLGVRWVHQGRDRNAGIDCLGLIVVVAEDLGYPLEDYTTYSREPDPLLIQTLIGQQMEASTGDPVAGDMALLHFDRRRKSPYHFGIISDTDTLIHGHGPSRQVVEQPLRMYSEQIHSLWKFPRLN
jgi:cell wall-associated NlpC family hydrolase